MIIPTNTLTRFIIAEQRKNPGASGELSDLLSTLALGVKMVSAMVATAGLQNLYGLTGDTNVQGEATQKLDVKADEIFADLLGSSGHFSLMVTEERDSVLACDDTDDKAKYVVAFDPLDGSSNLGTGVPVGTIFAIWKKLSLTRSATLEDFYQPGSQLVAAGYALYGSSTLFVYSSGDGVNEFTLEPTIGEFILSNHKIRIPEEGKIYSINEGNSLLWDQKIKTFIDDAKSDKLSARYVGSMVADVHRTLHKGGIFMYPGDQKSPKGKLRLLYECIPMSFIVEQAGGAAIDGNRRILDIVPTDIHERMPLILGGKKIVDKFLRTK